MADLARYARGHGVQRFDAKVLPSNQAMLSVFQHSGFPVTTEFDGDAYTVAIDLSDRA
jgi:RimJ/RimL family protein N-acetyltransferase